jgi:hypothetical protein
MGPATAEIAALPLEKRYVWRVVSALQWAFADMDTLTVEVDRQIAFSGGSAAAVGNGVCLYLSTLFGQKRIEVRSCFRPFGIRATVPGQSGGTEPGAMT